MTSRKPLRVAMVSLGCPKNLIDSEKIMAALAEGGCVVGAPMDEADVIVVNTCGFIEAARQESMGVIAEAVAAKTAGRARRVVVAGCLVNREADQLFELAPGIDAIVGVNNREDILKAVLGRGKISRAEQQVSGVASDAGRFRLTPRHTAYLRISEGCSRRCSFCTIPAIRGPFRSKPLQEVLGEAAELIADGAVELNVIGQDTSGYGRDLAGGPHLAGLLAELDRLEGVQWIRLMYAYPTPFDDELIEVIASAEHVVPYVDMPLQHIADGVLRRMGRGTRRSQVERLLDRLRERIPGLVLRTTFIVGFPGETEADFEQLLAFVKDRRFDALGVFSYSAEEGTPAAVMGEQVDEALKAERAEQIMLAQQEIAFAANAAAVGAEVQVLVDGVDAEGICVGRHYGQAPEIDSVCKLSEPRPAGEFVEATIVGWDDYDLLAAPK